MTARRHALSLLLILAGWPVCAALTINLVAHDEPVTLEGAVLVARPLSADGTPATIAMPIGATVSMEQINRQFRPYILPVPVGVPVTFPNRDLTAHHVYSFSRVRTFELPLYKSELPDPITFDEPGIVPLGCNIHDWMLGYIVVVAAPMYTQMIGYDATFENLEPGSYEISLWHPALQNDEWKTWSVDVKPGAAVEVLSLDEPIRLSQQPQAPPARFDEMLEY